MADAFSGVGTVDAALAAATAVLSSADVPTPSVDAELLLAHATGVERGVLLARAVTRSPVTREQVESLVALVSRRASREPLQHITGTAWFRSLALQVGPGVFVPRPETEGVAQLAVDALRAAPSAEPLAVDLGTGSGALALALATEVPHSRVWAVEISPEAAAWTRRNIDSVGASNVTLVLGDMTDALPELDGRVSVVVSNPPYIPLGMVPRDPEVRLHDPSTALYGGEDGLVLVRALSLTARRLLHPGGALVIEHGEQQGAAIRGILDADGWRSPETQPDLTGRDRSTTAVR
ncbi:peptide chain release factor N(5)-glutamine methyltransferase [Frigoribacterium sp. CFBP 8754]|uniref:peptide chain release factor N(5)-glutamine methyltransferase n=1 Tax=unclassified Frigoribacterium TaxID=2627005 RepID=UPI0006FA1247|nr:protein-(glutamine-N5) methyltransferase, release factor-specific [Frigoribacterium sp. Leaf164]MBD8659236.1 peptide chain release factor N(5)-glutamine methyltransferase [Frigoribacterium sp. CFBP 8754]